MSKVSEKSTKITACGLLSACETSFIFHKKSFLYKSSLYCNNVFIAGY